MQLIGVRDIPFVSRRCYYYELKHILLWSLLAGLIEGQFASVVVSKTFHGGAFLIAVASATPMASMLFSLAWGMLSVGRRKIPLLMAFVTATAVTIGLLAIVPATRAGAVWFVAQMALAQVLLSGVVTIRSAVWRANYPREARGRITARLQAVRRFLTVVVVLTAAAVCDFDATAYRYIFGAVAVLALVSVIPLRRLRIRGEKRELAPAAIVRGGDALAPALPEPFGLTAILSPGHVLAKMIGVLRDDRRFRNYCLAQTLTGSANLMTLAIIVTLITRHLAPNGAWGFWVSTALIVALPNLTLLGSIGRWARLFDRFGVLHMRVTNVACWLVSLVFAATAAWVVGDADRFGPYYVPVAAVLFAGRGLLNGLGLGGGTLAWNLGHLHFARPEDAEVYMGVHVSLTGLRGLIAPVLGMWLWHTIGWSVWLVALALSASSLLLYAYMAREERLAENQAVGATRGDGLRADSAGPSVNQTSAAALNPPR